MVPTDPWGILTVVGNRPVAVIRLPDGGWAVKEQAEDPPVSIHTCQSVAQTEALKLARSKGELVVVCDHGPRRAAH